MYQSYDFVYAGVPASYYGMSVFDLGNKKHGDNKFGNQANIVETRLANRITPLHYGVAKNRVLGKARTARRFIYHTKKKYRKGF